jgi:hypothetical protein
MTVIQYTAEGLLKLRDSPLVQKPDGILDITQWLRGRTIGAYGREDTRKLQEVSNDYYEQRRKRQIDRLHNAKATANAWEAFAQDKFDYMQTQSRPVCDATGDLEVLSLITSPSTSASSDGGILFESTIETETLGEQPVLSSPHSAERSLGGDTLIGSTMEMQTSQALSPLGMKDSDIPTILEQLTVAVAKVRTNAKEAEDVLRVENDALQKENAELKAENDKRREAYEKILQELNDVKLVAKALDSADVSLQAELDELIDNMEKLNTENAKLLKFTEVSTTCRDDLRNQLAAAEQQLKPLSDELDGLKRTNQDVQHELQTVKHELQQAREEQQASKDTMKRAREGLEQVEEKANLAMAQGCEDKE